MTYKKLTPLEWFYAARPWSYPASTMPVIGTIAYLFFREGGFPYEVWLLSALSVIAIIMLHSAGNLISDYFDYKWGLDQIGGFGQQNIVNGTYNPKHILIYGISCLIIGSIIGLIIFLSTGIEVLLIGVLGGIIILLYPLLKKYFLGDLAIYLDFGLLPVLGMSYVIGVGPDIWLLILSLVFSFITIDILHANNTRDRDSDFDAGTRSFAYLIGPRLSIWYFNFLIIIPYLLVVLLVLLRVLPWLSLASLLSLPLAHKAILQMRQSAQSLEKIHNLDVNCAKIQLVFNGILSISLFAMGIINQIL